MNTLSQHSQPTINAILLHGGALGDFVMTLRIIAALRIAGAERITVAARSHTAHLALRGGADDFLDIERGGFHTLFSDQMPLNPDFARLLSSFDLAITMTGGATVNHRLHAAGVSRVISIDPRPREGCSTHITDQWLHDLNDAGMLATTGPPCIRVQADEIVTSRNRLREISGSTTFALLHPGSGSPTKCWPLERFIELSHRMRHAGFTPFFLLGPIEAERMTAIERERIRTAAPIIDQPNFNDLSACLAAAMLYIGNDCGVTHLAAAIGIPTLAIFGPTDPIIWSPLGDHVAVLRSTPPLNWPVVDEVLRRSLAHARMPADAAINYPTSRPPRTS